MKHAAPEHSLEFLLAFDGQVHWFEGGYRLKFEIRRVLPTATRPHGLRYSFTLHGPKGERLVGFDNAHRVRAMRAGSSRKPTAADHWHRSAGDAGRPYVFKDAATLMGDFFKEVERVLAERGTPLEVVSVDDGSES